MTKKVCTIFLALTLIISFASCSKSQDSVGTISPTENEAGKEDRGNKVGSSSNTDENKEQADRSGKTAKKEEAYIDYMKYAEGLRPYAVMIDNEGTRCLPQGGLHLAQVIYEIIVEGGETRLMPVFWNVNPEMIGPVRSSRHYFLDYAMEHDAIYIHFGWSPKAKEDILHNFKIDNANGVGYGGEIFWDLTDNPGNWQDSYTSMERIKKFVEKAKYSTKTDKKLVFSYNRSDVQIQGGRKAEEITLKYSHSYTCGFKYDASTKTYKRFRKGKPQTERVSGKQLEAKNIIIQNVKNYTIKGDDAGRQEVNTVGKGDGWYITCGKAIKIKWSKASRTSPTRYVDDNGNKILLNPGQTWVQILPLYGEATIK